MTLKERIEEVLADINPRLEALADGYVEFSDLNEVSGVLTITSFGGRLH